MKQTFMNLETSLRDLISSRADASNVHTQGLSNLSEIAISMISLNPDQPRKDFDEAELNELAASIRETGIITPVTLRQTGGNEYQIIAGERRWRAAQLAGLTTIPAYIWTAENEKWLTVLVTSRLAY